MSNPDSLILTSYLAPNGFWFYQAVAAHLQQALDINVQITESPFDPLDDPTLLNNRVDLAFICGLPFIRHYQRAPDQFQPVVAPVMQLARYTDRPVYFSDVVVRVNSRVQTFKDLSGKTFCYNDPGSNSGYNLLCHHLIQQGYSPSFFQAAFQSGSHQRSIQAVLASKADYAAIDSTVLEQERRDFPDLSNQLRVIESIGPCPMPPIVVAQRLGKTLIDRIQAALLEPDLSFKQVMAQAGMHRYESVSVDQYRELADHYEAVRRAGYDTVLAAASR